MYTVQVFKTGAPLVKQITSEIPEPLSFEDTLGRLMHTTQHGEQAEYTYMDGFVVVGPVSEDKAIVLAQTKSELNRIAGRPATPVQQYVVTILDLDDIEVAGTYGPYTDEAATYSLAEVLLSGHQEDDPDTNYDSRVTPVYNEGGRG